ncbi:hypothetical protein CONPUDRAFT_125283 [Coniophora puteana RWD-64-598 SS2]|uniref:Uncharacterized protein n=1 Tax=Coniophora puteana (strain RWD-64-598) TaxID=741705 RepID=A0A5M3MMU1_CONPW|nr:uncharacterized protein CONPUDRAFT_125283 [Coniophora puteana RWD-64-598 SS2]EIW80499.1 hypothetical protein CONPUDRAFT_125283 [Coniophora puteana RWD-64-598 SS2]
MSTGSPAAFLLWTILSCLFLAFLIFHLWSYDKFKCLRWSRNRQPGAFKRMMAYTYLATVTLLIVFSVATTVIKFNEGYIVTPGPEHHIIPKPPFLYSRSNARWIIPLNFVFSFAWAFELVTHLEELMFWIFLQNQGSRARPWFDSWEFRVFTLGTITAVLGLPLTALITRREQALSQAWIFLVGSSASTFTTVLFLWVLWKFPRFIRRVKDDGGEPAVVLRLVGFYQLNCARIIFRFMFSLPLFIISLDGVADIRKILWNPFSSDFLLMIAGIGCFVSSAITLLVFFPRSLAQENGYATVRIPPPADSVQAQAPSPKQFLGTGQEVQQLRHRVSGTPKDTPTARNSIRVLSTTPRDSLAPGHNPILSPTPSEIDHAYMMQERAARGGSPVDAASSVGSGSFQGDGEREPFDGVEEEATPEYEAEDPRAFYANLVSGWAPGSQVNVHRHLHANSWHGVMHVSAPGSRSGECEQRRLDLGYGLGLAHGIEVGQGIGQGHYPSSQMRYMFDAGSRGLVVGQREQDVGNAESRRSSGRDVEGSNLHPYLREFRSPIDLCDMPEDQLPRAI